MFTVISLNDDEYHHPENGEDLELDMEKMMEGAEDSENVQKNDNAVEINNNDGNVQNTHEDLNSDDAKEKELPESNETVDNVQRTNDPLNQEKELPESNETVDNVQRTERCVKQRKGGASQ